MSPRRAHPAASAALLLAALLLSSMAGCAAPSALEPTPLFVPATPPRAAAPQLRPAHDPWTHRGLSRWDDGWDEWGNFLLFEREFRDRGLVGDTDHFGVGLELAGAPYGSWLAFEFGLWGSASEADWTNWSPVFRDLGEERIEAGESGSRSFEISVGVRKEYRLFDGPIVVYGGAGAAMLQLEEAVNDGVTFDDDSDADLGLYLHWGAYVALGVHGGIGFDARFVEGTEYELRGRSISGDYAQVALVFGFWF